MGAVLAVALPVFGLILTGAIAGRARFLGEDATRVLNLFVVYLALPAVLVQAMAHIRPVDLAAPGLLLAYGVGILVPFLLALVVARRNRIALADATLHALSGSYANVGYMGIPLCLTAFGQASVIPGVISMVITACPQFAVAVTLIELDRQQQPHLGRMLARVGGALARNPLLIAPLIGIVIAASGHALPVALDRFLGLLAGAATPCALVATGLMIAETGERFRPGLVAWLTLLKLLVQPAVTWVIAFHLVRLPVGWAETALVMSALPTGTGAFILAKLYGREAATTSGTVLVSTVLSFFTLSALLAWTGARG